MPFTATEFKNKHNQNLTTKEAKTAAKIANELMASGREEGDAIRIANGIILKNRKATKNKNTNNTSPKGKK